MAALSSITGEHATHIAAEHQKTAAEQADAAEESSAHTGQESRKRSRAERAWR
jgi:hypothetical protein